MKYFVFLTLFLSLEVSAQEEKKRFFEDRRRGWYWGEETAAPQKEDKKEQNLVVPVTPPPKQLTPTEIVKVQRESWEAARDAAVIDPSEENVLRYVKETNEIMAQANRFGSSFEKVLWRHPEFDPGVVDPVDRQSLKIGKVVKQEQQNQELERISKKYGFLYFFKGTCEFCQKFSPVLKKLTAEKTLSVTPFTLDGLTLPGYESSGMNETLATQLQVTKVPALYIVNPETGAIGPVSFGAVAEDQLIARIIAAEETVNEKGK